MGDEANVLPGAYRPPALARWLERRSVLHHDWFSNRMMTFVQAQGPQLGRLRSLPDPLRELCEEGLAAWDEHAGELRRWNREAEAVFHPAQIIETPLFAALPGDSRRWLADVTDKWYRTQDDLHARVARVDGLWVRIDDDIRRLRQGEAEADDDGEVLYRAMYDMHKEISAYPAQVLLP